jgi:hypothetical protein
LKLKLIIDQFYYRIRELSIFAHKHPECFQSKEYQEQVVEYLQSIQLAVKAILRDLQEDRKELKFFIDKYTYVFRYQSLNELAGDNAMTFYKKDTSARR